MGVIVTNMAMPSTCYECRFCNSMNAENQVFVCDCYLSFIPEPRKGKLDTCPLVELPTIEPNHGKWMAKSVSIKGVPTEACSECGEWSFGDGMPFCPNCGARMDGDELEEPEINPCRGCDDYDGRGGCKSHGACGAERSEE